MTNRLSLMHCCNPIAGISYHEAIFIESSITLSQHQCTKRKFYLWHKADISSINEIIIQFTSSFLNKFSTSTPIDILWEEMCYEYLDLVPTKFHSTGSKQPWVNSYIKRLSRKKQRLYNLVKCSNSSHNWETYRTYKRKVQGDCCKAYNNYIGGLIDKKGSVTKRLWSYIKSQRKDHCGIAPLKVDEVVYNNSLDKAEILNEYFSSVFTPISLDTPPAMDEPLIPDIDPIQVDTNGVELLKVHKAAGPDEIPAQLLKETSDLLAPSLTLIYQASLHQCSLPADWKRAYIVPIFKKGSRAAPNNYRPVSLTCKILEHISVLTYIHPSISP